MTAPKRRWSFSLRTLFVVVTVVGAFLGWFFLHWHWITDRERARQWVEQRDGFIVYAGQPFAIQSDNKTLLQTLDGTTSVDGKVLNLPKAPWSLRILGEQTAYFVVLCDTPIRPPMNMAEVEAKLPELRRLFPESDIRVNFVQRNAHDNITPNGTPPKVRVKPDKQQKRLLDGK